MLDLLHLRHQRHIHAAELGTALVERRAADATFRQLTLLALRRQLSLSLGPEIVGTVAVGQAVVAPISDPGATLELIVAITVLKIMGATAVQ